MSNRLISLLFASVGLSLVLTGNASAYEAKRDCETQANTYFTFAWPLSDDCANRPRGGTSKGTDVELATQPRQQWLDLQQQGISKYERDRRAILAMQGGYKVNFDFLETVGFSDDYERDRPY